MRISIGQNFRQSGYVNFENLIKRILTFEDYFCLTELKNISTGKIISIFLNKIFNIFFSVVDNDLKWYRVKETDDWKRIV